jgi:hypothetical protein
LTSLSENTSGLRPQVYPRHYTLMSRNPTVGCIL